MILLFAGAGASKAVNPTRYPTTVEFFDALPHEIKVDRLFVELCNYLRVGDPKRIVDIEQVLWTLSETRDALKAITNPQTSPGWFFQNDRAVQVTNAGPSLGPVVDLAARFAAGCDGLESAINTQIYEWYGVLPDARELEDSWVPLLHSLSSLSMPLHIFTTNYDLVIEEALAAAQSPIRTGRTSGVQPVLDEALWSQSLSASEGVFTGLLTKLHGSVDWTRGKSVIHVGTPTFRGRHADHVILYPGFKGVPTGRPFTLFHDHFVRVAREARIAIFVGFAFRDIYINQVLRDQLNRHARIIVINPAKTLTELPFQARQFDHLATPFTAESAADIRTVLAAEL